MLQRFRDIAIYGLVILIGCGLSLSVFFGFGALFDAVSVQAAPPAPPEVVACAPINTAGLIVVYRCLPEQGAPYLINSLGFMKDEE